jgi:protein-S-isoprenylcysteine O-methyltransferase Ste14
MAILTEIKNRKLDILWVALSIGFAIVTWRYALREPYWPVWLFIALHLQCAIIFAIRQTARCTSKRPLEFIVTILSLNYIFAFEIVPIGTATFARVGALMTASGALLTLISVQQLGRSFAVLPSVREIRTSGLYRWIRHPIYFSYMVTALGILLRHLTFYNVGVALAGFALILCRLHFEERLLARDEAYRAYMKAVPYRLIPGVY